MTNLDNLLLKTDSYKTSHALQYPKGTETIYSYFESRVGAKWDDTVFFGLQYYIKKYLTGKVVTREKIDSAKKMIDLHMGEGIFYSEGWEYILDKYDGRLPIRIKAVPEGTPVTVSNVLMTIENLDPNCWWLTNYLETLLVQVWYASSVATLSRENKKVIKRYLEETSEELSTDFRLHDFGYRGVSSDESAGLGAMSHLVNFKGSDTMIGLVYAQEYYNCEMAGFSIPACYSEDTEILTSKGFKLFKELDNDDLVAEYKESGDINFINPEAIHKYPFNGNLINFKSKKTRYVDLLVTPNHRMVGRSKKDNSIKIKEAKDFLYSSKNKCILAGNLSGSNKLSDEERLKIAFQADGAYPSRKEKYNGSRSGHMPIRFSLIKLRKISRLNRLLDSTGYDYNRSLHKSSGKVYFWIKCPYKFSKVFDWIDLNTVSKDWCIDFIEELAYWDGKHASKNSISYSTIIKQNADMVQAIASLCGYSTNVYTYNDKRTNCDRKTIYECHICKNKTDIGGETLYKKEISYNGNVYCVTVPSGMIVVKRNDCVSVCGNSEHSTMTSWGKDHEVSAMRNMLNIYSNSPVFACVSDSWDIYNACANIWGLELKNEIIKRNGGVVIRPDSGDPLEVIPKLLDILSDRFGTTVNSKGYRVLNYVRLIQGDGITPETIPLILEVVKDCGFSTENISFGSGGGLLQKLDRDTQRFAFKCSYAVVDGEERDVFKNPTTDASKASKKGRLSLIKNENGEWETIRESELKGRRDYLVTVFENGDLLIDDTLDKIRMRAEI